VLIFSIERLDRTSPCSKITDSVDELLVLGFNFQFPLCNYTPKKLQFHIAWVEKHIDEYLKQLDDSGQEEEKGIVETPIKKKDCLASEKALRVKSSGGGS